MTLVQSSLRTIAVFGFLLTADAAAFGEERAQQRSVPLDQLDADAISKHERFDWQPPELVAVIGTHHAGRHWEAIGHGERGYGNSVTSPDGALIASGGSDAVLRFWNAKTLRQLAERTGHDGPIRRVAFAPNGRRVATAGTDATVLVWQIEAAPELSVELRETLKGNAAAIHSLMFSHDGHLLAAGDHRGTVVLWDFSGAETEQWTLPPTAVERGVKAQPVAFSPDGKQLATGDYFNVRLWNIESRPPTVAHTLEPQTGKLRRSKDYPSVVQTIAYSPDGTTLAAGHYNSGGVRVWDLTGDLQRETAWLDGHTTRSVRFSPDGRSLLSAGSPGWFVWDVTNGGTLRTRFRHSVRVMFSADSQLQVHPRARHRVTSHRQTAISPDGRLLATSSSDRMLNLWTLGGPKPTLKTRFPAETNGAPSPWRSHPTASDWSPATTTARCACGTSARTRRN